MIDKEQVLAVVKMKGLVVPSDLVKEFHADTFIMGAVLSDLVHDKKVGVTTVKMGGSPVYYAFENKEKLVDLYKYLHEKDKTTFQLLKEKKVLSDIDQTPLVRVSLRTIKDYSKPIEVTVASQTKLFWKWYLATEQDVQEGLRALFSQQPQQVVSTSLPQESPVPIPPIKQKRIVTVQKQIPLQQLSLAPSLPSSVSIPHDNSFAQQVALFFSQKQGVFVRFSIIKKGEIDCIVDVPATFGSVRYFCKAKNKKKCNEGEFATVFVAPQLEKLPALFLTTGYVSQKLLDKINFTYPNMKIITISEVK